MKLSEFIKKETDALSEKYVLEAAEADADTNTSPVLIRGTKMHTVKNVLTTAACTVLVVAIAVSALILPGVLTGDTTPGDVVDEGTTGETEFTPETLQSGTQLEYNGEYQYKIFGEQVSIYSYNGDATEITIPQEIDGCKVWFLDARKGTPDDGVGILPISVIEGTDVTSVTIEGGIRGVRMYAFYNSQNLETLVFKDISYDISIDYGAFQNCTNLKSVTFAEGVTDIRLYAFRGCTSLKEITIPASVIEIGSEAFADCTSLEKVTFLSDKTVVAEDAFLNTPYAEYAENVIQLEVPETFSVSDVDLSSVTAAKIYNLVTGDVAFLTEAEDVLAICDVSAALSGTDPKSSRGYYGEQYGYCLYEIELYETTKSAPILNFILCKVSDGECYVLSADIYETMGETNNYRAMYNTDGNVFKKIEKVCDDYFK